MKELVYDLLKYMRTREVNVVLRDFCLDSKQTASFVTMVIDVIAWLKLGYKRELWINEGRPTKHKALSLNMDYSWCQILKDVTDNDKRFSNYFIINEKGFDFKESISEQERIEAMKIAYDNYNPPMSVTRRR